MRVNQARQQRNIAKVDRVIGLNRRVVVSQKLNSIIPNGRRRLCLPRWQHHPSRSNDQPLAHDVCLTRSQPKDPVLSAGSDGAYSSPTQPAYPSPASAAKAGLEVERAGAGRPASRRVGHLDVHNRVPVAGEYLSHVFPHLRQVVEIRQEPHVRRSHLFDHRHGAGAGVDREPGNVHGVNGLDEHRRSDPTRRPRRQPKIVDGNGVLRVVIGPGRPQPVRRVQPRAPGPPRDLDARGHVLAELTRPARMGQDSALSGRHVPGVKVQRDELDPGVADRPDERVGLRVGRHHPRPRPPELHPVEPGRPRRRRPLNQRQLGKENRAVDIEPQPVRPHR